uniref:CUB domain-containing protein n=1 Tax=Panagrellus redivivus TaxID=6233 RepID=A0A7E4UQI9_PANRE
MFFSVSAFDILNEKLNLFLALILVFIVVVFLTYGHCYFEHDKVALSVHSTLTIDTSEVDIIENYEESDEVSSVYAWDANNDDAAAEDEVYFEADPIEDMPTEASSSFGFCLPNRGESYSYEFYTENCMFDFVDETTTHFHANNGDSLTFVFEGQDLKMVVHDVDEYTSYESLPTNVADILAIARVELIESSLF